MKSVNRPLPLTKITTESTPDVRDLVPRISHTPTVVDSRGSTLFIEYIYFRSPTPTKLYEGWEYDAISELTPSRVSLSKRNRPQVFEVSTPRTYRPGDTVTIIPCTDYTFDGKVVPYFEVESATVSPYRLSYKYWDPVEMHVEL